MSGPAPETPSRLAVGVLRGATGTRMISTVNREGSCNACHKPNPGSRYSLPGDDARESVGQIYAPDESENAGAK